MTAALLFIAYSILFGWWLTRLRISKNTGLPPHIILSLFGLKLVTGVAYGYIYSLTPDYAKKADTWNIYFESLKEYKLLLADPVEFFSHFFYNPDHLSYTNFFGSTNSYWNDLKDQLLARVGGIINLFSFGDYYVDVAIYSFLTFIGSIVFYRVLQLVFATKPLINTLVVFLIPSFLFWTGGMYKDGYIFLLLAIIFFQCVVGTSTVKRVFILLLCVSGLFLLRSYVVLLLLPALASWLICKKVHLKPVVVFPVVYILLGCVILFGQNLHPSLNFPSFIAQRQADFVKLEANSKLAVTPMEASVNGMLTYAPVAVNHGFFRPHIAEGKGVFYLPFAIELAVFYLLLLVSFVARRQLSVDQQTVALTLICFSCSCWLFIGYVCPILGALVRYKSIYLPLFAGALSALTDWDRLRIKYFTN